MARSMRAMMLMAAGQPLKFRDVPVPEPGPHQVLIEVAACGVCRTDLHVADGEIPDPRLPLIPGHEIVGYVAALGGRVTRFSLKQRVGVPWLGETCGHCPYCESGRENLCDEPQFTGYTINGGYAQFAIAHEDFCFPLPDRGSDVELAPLLCAGLIGYRSLVLAGEGERIGLYGFGAAAHILAQVLRHQGRRVYAFTRPQDFESQAFAKELGAYWVGGSNERAPDLLDAAIIFAPAGELVPLALQNVRKGGRVICAGIHMSDIPAFPYALLWGERQLRSVANLTRQDGEAFFALAGEAGVRTRVEVYDLGDANRALDDLRAGRITGAAVLVP